MRRANWFWVASFVVAVTACGDDESSSTVSSAVGGAGGAGGSATTSSSGGTGGSGATGGGVPSIPTVLVPRTGLEPSEVGILVNDADPLSVSTAAYYATARGIPAANVVHLNIPDTTAAVLSEADFAPLASQVDAALMGTDVQALAITWTRPYRVGNMSVTSAFALGFKAIDDTCTDPNSQAGTPNPYNTNPGATRPYDELGFRPVMTIPATTEAEAEALIDRGVAADNTWPTGSAYLMNTSDQTRSARCILEPMFGYTNECQLLLDVWDGTGSGIDAAIYNQNAITGADDIMFYVQGLAQVPDINTNTYLPGAVADHLTSFGGRIPTSGQMSAFEFLQAGATGSFGTVVEPCAYQQKFPDPAVLVPSYFGGATLIEAYWRSVDWPAEGIFIGEPLARPFGNGFRTDFTNSTLTIETTIMVPGRTYLVEASDSEQGPFEVVQDQITVPLHQRATIEIENATRAFYSIPAAIA